MHEWQKGKRCGGLYFGGLIYEGSQQKLYYGCVLAACAFDPAFLLILPICAGGNMLQDWRWRQLGDYGD